MTASSKKRVGMVLFALLGLAIALVAWLYLAGFFYLALGKMDPMKADLLTFRQYWHHWGHLAAVKKRLIAAGGIAAFVIVLVPTLMALLGRPRRELHGSARFATSAELARSGLTRTDDGIVVGKHQGRYLVFGGQQFVILAAPTRSGKGVGVVIPNLLSFNDSVVVLDIKQENFDLTAGFRAKHGHEVYLFNPFAEDMRTHRYNPLGYISDNPHFRVSDILAIGYAFWPGTGKDPFWEDQARNLFVGLTLYLCETPEIPRTIGELYRQATGKGMPVKDYLQSLVKGRAEKGAPLSNECVDAINRFCSTSDNTLAGILATFNGPLGNWVNPIVDAATSANDFDLRDVRKRRMTIYIGITPDHLAEAAVLVNVLFSQLVNLNTKELPKNNPALKHQCLLLMDEFTAIGKVTIIAKAVSYMAGYNLRLLPIIQSVSQLASVYGPEDARTFITNHALQILYAPREQKDANEYSEMLGTFTMKNTSKSRSFGKSTGRSESTSDNRRPLLLPQEFKELGQDKEVIMLENTKPILCDKIRYYEDPVFTARLLDPPAVPTLDLDRHIAVVQERTRDMVPADVAGGVDLSMVAADFSALPTLEGENVSDVDVQSFVSDFFSALGVDLAVGEVGGDAADATVATADVEPLELPFEGDGDLGIATESDEAVTDALLDWESEPTASLEILDDNAAAGEGTDWAAMDVDASPGGGVDLSVLEPADERSGE